MNPLSPMRAMRRAKHRAFVAYKPYRFQVAGSLEPAFRAVHRLKPPTFNSTDWTGTHLPYNEPLTRQTNEPIPRRIYCFWTGDNDLSANRRRALDEMRRLHTGIEIKLVTPSSLSEIVLPEHPLHPAYDNLAWIHRADYLRCYVLHFHGGGYADIKTPLHPWGPVFDRMDGTDCWMGGYRVPVRLMGPNIPDPQLERKMIQFSEHRLGQCSYLARPQTPISAEWWRQLNTVLDEKYEALLANPGNARGDNPGYPIEFTSILAQILDPILVKYRSRLFYDFQLMPTLENYL
ncbi:glycosyltransferase family 32 protein [Calidifontibacter terrae]